MYYLLVDVPVTAADSLLQLFFVDFTSLSTARALLKILRQQSSHWQKQKTFLLTARQ
jgi:hypothetical protein